MKPALEIKKDFPIFAHHPQLVYLDNAATTFQPEAVIAAQAHYAREGYGPIHRTMYDQGIQATATYEGVREKVALFLGAAAQEIIFTRSATEALNLTAWIEAVNINAGDEIMLSVAEHHSNLLPWQRLARQRGAKLVWVELTNDFQIDLHDFAQKVSPRTKIVAVTHISNVTGAVTPLEKIIPAAHAVGAKVVVDAAQSAARLPLNAPALDVDYLVFSGHKIYGPPGIGVLYGKSKWLSDAEPLLLGGGMVTDATRKSAQWIENPGRFEAGTPDSVAVVGLGAALDYLAAHGFERLKRHEQKLLTYTLKKFAEHSDVHVFGPRQSTSRAGIFSFQVVSRGKALHSHDVASIANERAVALRAGHHCAQPLLATLGVAELVRASIGIYTTTKDIDALFRALEAVKEVLALPIKKRATVPTA